MNDGCKLIFVSTFFK